MYSIKKIILAFLLIPASAGILYADLFYTQKQYNDLYNEKIAVELELKSLREQFKNERGNLLEKVRQLFA